MGKKDSRIDLYITKAKPFAQPILNHLRDLVHKGCPDIEETVKWGMPSFDYKGPFCSMAAFKEHAAFGFWKASLMKDAEKLKDNQQSAMGHAGKIKSLKDLPSDKTLISWIKEAAKLNDDGIKLPPRKKSENKDLIIPDYFTKALSKNKKALQAFEKFPPSHKKEYVQWITEAKTEDTRNRRMETALEWIAEGKGRNWKYERK
ncbi:MAG TPA: YdeI/OmpD-associated family protein [Chitinophagaceae bacterium]|nr:YdeI/OmpD-associated family protein [Chitinophagaceae bacterium]